MEFIDLKAQYLALKDKIDGRVADVLSAGNFIMGPEVAEFERALAEYCGVEHVVSCANGTDALMLALRAYGIGPGDIVVTTPFTFFATVEAIMTVGATPVFADIDRRTYNIDAELADEAIATANEDGRRVKAVISVDLFGLPADHQRLASVCAGHGVKLIEDAAQGFGGECRGRRAGALGDVATTSFFPAKPLGCYGDGGALLTDDAELAAMLRSLRVHGKGDDKYDNVRVGFNSRLDTIQAAILLEKLAAFPAELKQRQRVAERYTRALPQRLTLPTVPQGYLSSWAQYCVLAPDAGKRTTLMAALAAADIPSAIYYARPMHLQTALACYGAGAGSYPVAEEVATRIFALPMSPYLSERDQDRVIEVLTAACR